MIKINCLFLLGILFFNFSIGYGQSANIYQDIHLSDIKFHAYGKKERMTRPNPRLEDVNSPETLLSFLLSTTNKEKLQKAELWSADGNKLSEAHFSLYPKNKSIEFDKCKIELFHKVEFELNGSEYVFIKAQIRCGKSNYSDYKGKFFLKAEGKWGYVSEYKKNKLFRDIRLLFYYIKTDIADDLFLCQRTNNDVLNEVIDRCCSVNGFDLNLFNNFRLELMTTGREDDLNVFWDQFER